MEKFKKFKQEYKKDFVIPFLSTTKEKDIFIYIFRLLREKINKGIFPEISNNEIIYSKSDLKNLISKEIIFFMKQKKGWIITINPTYSTKNVECPWCGAKFNEKIYFRQKRMRCPSCMSGMNGSTIAEKFETDDIIFPTKTENINKEENKTKIEKVTTDIKSIPTDIERTMQIARQEIIPFQTSKADKINAISTLNQIASEKNKSLALIAQKEILANFSNDCIILLREYFFVGNKFFSATKYMNMRLSEVVKDPRFIGNTSRKSMLLAEMKYACEQLCGNAEIRSVTEVK